MPIDFTKPSTTDNYATAFVPNINNAINALGFMLDPVLTGTYTSIPTGTKRLVESTNALERYNGTAWVAQNINGVGLSGTITTTTGALRVNGASLAATLSVRDGTTYGGGAANTAFDGMLLDSNVATGISILTPNSVSAGIVFGDPQNNAAGRLVYNHTNDSLTLSVAALAQSFVLNSTTASWSAAFSATGTGRFGGATQGVLGVRDGLTSAATANAVADGFVIDSDTSSGLSILTPGSASGSIYFGDSANSAVGRIVYNHATDTMSLLVAGATQLSLTADVVALSVRATLSPGAITGAASSAVGSTLSLTPSTYTDNSTAASGTLAVRAAASMSAPTFAASNTSVTYTHGASLYLDAQPAAGTNVTITNRHAIYAAAGRIYAADPGSAAVPSFAVRDVNTGLYSSATGVLNITTGGTLAVSIGSEMTLASGVDAVLNTSTGPTNAGSMGFRGIPQNSRSANYTLVLADAGKHVLHPSADTTARTFTIPANASVAYPIGTSLTFINQNGAGTVTIAITTDTMRLIGTGSTGSRTLADNGIATAVKVSATEWVISGTNLT